MVLSARPSAGHLTPSGPRLVEGRERGAPYQTGLANTEGTKSVLAGSH